MSLVGSFREQMVFPRRIKALCSHIAALLPPDATVLDVGCGEGALANMLIEARADVSVAGIDVLVRPETLIPVLEFDGKTIPYADQSFDVVMLVDVLHHTTNQVQLLSEARRVMRKAVVLKDHCRDGFLANATLRLMDWVGNAHHGVVLPYNYWSEAEWRQTFAALRLEPEIWIAELGLYPWPFSAVFGRGLHFASRLIPRR